MHSTLVDSPVSLKVKKKRKIKRGSKMHMIALDTENDCLSV